MILKQLKMLCAPEGVSGCERAATEGRKVSFQLTIDDIYAVSMGHLIGRPSYND